MATFNDIPSILEDFCGWCTEKRVHFGPVDDPAHIGRDLISEDMKLIGAYLADRGAIILNTRSGTHEWQPRPRAHPDPGQVVLDEHPVFVTCDEYKHVPMCGHGSDSNGLIPKPPRVFMDGVGGQ